MFVDAGDYIVHLYSFHNVFIDGSENLIRLYSHFRPFSLYCGTGDEHNTVVHSINFLFLLRFGRIFVSL